MILQICSSHGRRQPHKPHQRSDVSGSLSSCAVALSLTSMERGLDGVPGFHRLPVIENTSRIMSPRCLWCVKNNTQLRWARKQRKASRNHALCLKNVSFVCTEKKYTSKCAQLWLGFDSPMNHWFILFVKSCNLVQTTRIMWPWWLWFQIPFPVWVKYGLNGLINVYSCSQMYAEDPWGPGRTCKML